MWRFKVGKDRGGNYRWRLIASNGREVAASGESFDSHANARRAAENVKANASSAVVEDD